MKNRDRGKWSAQISARVVILVYLAFIVGCGPKEQQKDLYTADALNSLTGTGIRNHMTVLAADGMQGREAGTPGHQAAAEYVATQFSDIGLTPLGDDGTYFQDVEFLESILVMDSASMILHQGVEDTVLEFGHDFVQSGGFGERHESVTAPLVFVGFGIQAPEYSHDDFAGVDVAGKILVMMTGAPPDFATNERAFYSSGTGKQSLAVELGAVGIVTIRTPVDQNRLPWPRMQSAAASAGLRWLAADGCPQDGFPALKGNATLSESGAKQLFILAGRDLDNLFEYHSSGGTGSFELNVSATLERQSAQQTISSPNVLALLPGSDRTLLNEFVLFTAHLDHLGVRASVDGGNQIYNGAYDNAAGVATIVSVANAMRKLAPAPRRSVIFAAVTAEEKGLRGSDFLAHHPPVAIEQIVANINIDMPYLGYPIADVEGFGVEHSTLHDALIRATSQHSLELTADPQPELVRLIRSDQFSFVKQGVPGLNLKPGSMSLDPLIDSAELRSSFLREHYHSPSDDLTLPFSEEGALQFVRLVFTFGLIVANDDVSPKWKDGDFFGDKYADERSQ